jgi:hypothetical protein
LLGFRSTTELAAPDTNSVLLPQGASRWFAAGFARGRNVTMLSVSSPHLCLDGLPGRRPVFMCRQTKLRVPARGTRTRSDPSKGAQSAQILGNAYRLVSAGMALRPDERRFSRVIAAPPCCASFSGKAFKFKDCGSCRLDEATRRSSVGAPSCAGAASSRIILAAGSGMRVAVGCPGAGAAADTVPTAWVGSRIMEHKALHAPSKSSRKADLRLPFGSHREHFRAADDYRVNATIRYQPAATRPRKSRPHHSIDR